MSYANGPKIVTDGLVLCLDAANRKSYPGSGSTWYDLSGRGNNGTLINGTTFSSANGGLFDFDGTDDKVGVNSSDWGGVGTNLSVFAWIYRQGTAQISSQYLSIMNGSNDTISQYNFSFYVQASDFKLGGWTFTGTTANTFITNYVINANTWYYVGMTVQSGSTSTIKYYGNGNLISSHNASGTRFRGVTSNSIGQFASRNQYEFNGYIPNVNVYNKVLSANEVQQNYNALKGRYGLT